MISAWSCSFVARPPGRPGKHSRSRHRWRHVKSQQQPVTSRTDDVSCGLVAETCVSCSHTALPWQRQNHRRTATTKCSHSHTANTERTQVIKVCVGYRPRGNRLKVAVKFSYSLSLSTIPHLVMKSPAIACRKSACSQFLEWSESDSLHSKNWLHADLRHAMAVSLERYEPPANRCLTILIGTLHARIHLNWSKVYKPNSKIWFMHTNMCDQTRFLDTHLKKCDHLTPVIPCDRTWPRPIMQLTREHI